MLRVLVLLSASQAAVERAAAANVPQHGIAQTSTFVQPTVDVVLAHYKEDVGWLARERALDGARVLVYSKGGAEVNVPPNVMVKKLPNVGRESQCACSRHLAFTRPRRTENNRSCVIAARTSSTS